MASRATAQPLAAPPLFNATAQSLLDDTKRLLQRAKAVQDAIVAVVTPATATFDNTVLPIAQEENQRLYERQQIEFYGVVTTDAELQDASYQAEELFSKFDDETALRKDLYDVMVAVHDKTEALPTDTESRRFLEKFLLNFRRNGLSLSEEGKKRLREVNHELEHLKQHFLRCMRQDSILWFTQQELEGLNDGLINSLERGSGEHLHKLRLNIAPDQIQDIMRQIRSQETRRRIYYANAGRCEENVARLEHAIVLRHEKANLLSYSSYSQHLMATGMEKDPEPVQKFLEDLIQDASAATNAIVSKWRNLKRDDLQARGEHDDGKFYDWDRHYYSDQLFQNDYGLDVSAISEYFALPETITRMLGIFEHILGMKFQEISETDRKSAFPGLEATDLLTWHEDVRMFAVWNSADEEGRMNQFLGYLYMDMYSRDLKEGGFSDRPVRPAFSKSDGSRKHTATALVCNFVKPTATKPCLLNHSQVILLFHELGHGIHDLVAKTEFARFHGASCEDFNEVPSQMLEEWCWCPETLQILSHHYSNLSPVYEQTWRTETGNSHSNRPEALPLALVEQLERSKKDKFLLKCLGLANVSLFDLAINSQKTVSGAKSIDTTQLFHTIACRTFRLDMPYRPPPAQAALPVWFTVDGMYIYLTSLVYSLDMFQSVFKAHPMNREAGMRYRRTVIEKGSSEDEMKMLTDFLGRLPKRDALYRELGLS